MNRPFAKKASIATLGVVTVLSLSIASTPAFARGQGKGQGHGPRSGSSSGQGSEQRGTAQAASLAFTVTSVPASISSPSQIAENIMFKVIPLPADATSAPATPPAPEAGHHKNQGRFELGSGNTNPLTLSASTISGAIKIRGLKNAAGVQNVAVYPFLAADTRSGLAAQSGTPVFVVATTAADGSVTLSGQSGDLTLDLSLNTGVLKVAQTATVNVPNDGKTYALQIVRTQKLDEQGNPVADPRTPLVSTVTISGSGAVAVNLPDLTPGTYTFNLIQIAGQTTAVSIGVDGLLSSPLTIG